MGLAMKDSLQRGWLALIPWSRLSTHAFTYGRCAMNKVGIKIRLPKDLHKKLQAVAEANMRSLNSEMIFRLASTFGPEGAKYMVDFSEAVDSLKPVLSELLAEFVKDKLK